jgi:hypothetical protein
MGIEGACFLGLGVLARARAPRKAGTWNHERGTDIKDALYPILCVLCVVCCVLHACAALLPPSLATNMLMAVARGVVRLARNRIAEHDHESEGQNREHRPAELRLEAAVDDSPELVLDRPSRRIQPIPKNPAPEGRRGVNCGGGGCRRRCCCCCCCLFAA